MTELGKIDRPFFDEHVAPNLGAERTDVSLGPRHGVDFGVLSLDGTAVVVATDPVSILPELGFERAARFALDLILTDVAVSGIAPSHLSICFTLPPTMDDEAFAAVWETMSEECRDLGVAVTTGHTARYTGCSYPWIGAATAIGVGEHGRLVRPDGARPGDRLVLTTGPAVEAVGLLSTLFGDRMDLPDSVLADARDRLEDVYCVRDALTVAAAAPVTAMHDVTEGGLAAALCEMAEGSGSRFSIDGDAVPMPPGVREVCDALEIDPWHATSCGSLVIAVPGEHADDVVDALEDEGTVGADIGHVERGSGVVVDGESLEHPGRDPSWDVYAEFAGR